MTNEKQNKAATAVGSGDLLGGWVNIINKLHSKNK
jgi:hypothetical protein